MKPLQGHISPVNVCPCAVRSRQHGLHREHHGHQGHAQVFHHGLRLGLPGTPRPPTRPPVASVHRRAEQTLLLRPANCNVVCAGILLAAILEALKRYPDRVLNGYNYGKMRAHILIMRPYNNAYINRVGLAGLFFFCRVLLAPVLFPDWLRMNPSRTWC